MRDPAGTPELARGTLISSKLVDFEICNLQSKLLTLAISEVFLKEARSAKTNSIEHRTKISPT